MASDIAYYLFLFRSSKTVRLDIPKGLFTGEDPSEVLPDAHHVFRQLP